MWLAVKKATIHPNLSRVVRVLIVNIHGKQHDMKSADELYAAAVAGGPEDFAPIVERHQDAVFGVALVRMRNFHEAQDIAQENVS